MKYLALAALFAIAACATSEGTAEVTYQTAITGSTAYVQLSPCSTTKTTFCSKRSIVTQIKQSRVAAYDALRIARAANQDDQVTMATGAVKVFTDLIAMPEIQAALGNKQ